MNYKNVWTFLVRVAACIVLLIAVQSKAARLNGPKDPVSLVQSPSSDSIRENATRENATPDTYKPGVGSRFIDGLSRYLTIANITERLGSGHSLSYCEQEASISSILHTTRINVSIAFDRQPIGGIVTVRADLVPVFAGVGISNRPIASETYAAAVDYFDPQLVRTLALDLTQKLERSWNASMLSASADRQRSAHTPLGE